MVEEGTQRERALRRNLQSAYWLIEKIEDGPMEVLTVDIRGNQQALPVFSHREEAEMFLWLGRLADSWRASKSEGRELVRMFSGPYASIGFVALDPLPEMVADRMVGLVSLTRDRFTDRLTSGGEYRTTREDSERAEPKRRAVYRAPVP